MQTEATCQPEAARPAEQRFAPLLLVEMKALRIELRGEFLDVVGGEGERADLAPRADLRCPRRNASIAYSAFPSRRRTMIGDSISHSTTPAALRTVPLNVTMPVSGRLLETRASVTSTSSVRSSPGRKRRQPAHLVDAGRAERGGAADKAVEHHPHHDRAEMPARTGQALEHRLLRRLLVEMHRLRIELGGKGEDLLARDVARAEAAETAGLEIFEGQRGHGSRRFDGRKPDCGRYLQQSQPGRPHGSCPERGAPVSVVLPRLAREPVRG